MNTKTILHIGLIIAAIWPLLCLVTLAGEVALDVSMTAARTVRSILTWVEWSFLTFPIVLVAHLNPLWDRVTPKRVMTHVTAALFAPFAHLAIYLVAMQSILPVPRGDVLDLALDRLPRHLFFGVVMYAVITTLAQVLECGAATARNKARESHMRRELARTSLSAAVARMQPQWLLRALGAASELLASEPDRGEALVFRLADSLRLSLARLKDDTAPLDLDIRLARALVAAEGIRLGFPIELRTAVQPGAESESLPSGLLQFVVDSLLQGLSGPAVIDLHAGVDDGQFTLRLSTVDRQPISGVSLRLSAIDCAPWTVADDGERLNIEVRLECSFTQADVA